MKYLLTLNYAGQAITTDVGSMDIRLEAEHANRCMIFINDSSNTSFYETCSQWIMNEESPVITSMSLLDKETGMEVYTSTYWNKLSLMESNFYQGGIDHIVTLIHNEMPIIEEQV